MCIIGPQTKQPWSIRSRVVGLRHLPWFTALFLAGLAAFAVAPGQGQGLQSLQDQALALVNEARADQGISPLALNGGLSAAAQRHAEDMLTRGYYAHVSPEGATLGERYMRTGSERWHIVAENIARCEGCGEQAPAKTVAAFHRGWMNSDSHRENILIPGITDFGFGIALGPNGRRYAVQAFAGPAMPDKAD